MREALPETLVNLWLAERLQSVGQDDDTLAGSGLAYRGLQADRRSAAG